MVGVSIILLLVCGGLAAQGSHNRNSNSNLNTNVFYGRREVPPIENPDEPNDSKTASAPTATGNFVVTITEELINDLSEAVGIAVTESVALILRHYSADASEQNSDSTANEDIGINVIYPEVNQVYEHIGSGIGSTEHSTLNNDNDDEDKETERMSRRGWGYGSNSNYNVNTNINQNSFRRNAARHGKKQNYRRWSML